MLAGEGHIFVDWVITFLIEIGAWFPRSFIMGIVYNLWTTPRVYRPKRSALGKERVLVIV
jgi:hypothetical protein